MIHIRLTGSSPVESTSIKMLRSPASSIRHPAAGGGGDGDYQPLAELKAERMIQIHPANSHSPLLSNGYIAYNTSDH